jgi:hypothetical protein
MRLPMFDLESTLLRLNLSQNGDGLDSFAKAHLVGQNSI